VEGASGVGTRFDSRRRARKQGQVLPFEDWEDAHETAINEYFVLPVNVIVTIDPGGTLAPPDGLVPATMTVWSPRFAGDALYSGGTVAGVRGVPGA